MTGNRDRTAWPFAVIAGGLFVLLLSSNLPTPLYAGYEREFGFNRTVLVLIFVSYALVLVPSLMLFGQLSDRIGRRRVIVLGLGLATAGLVLFIVAGLVSRGIGWLFAARCLQGLAVGIVTGTAAAGLVEHEPHGDQRRAALFSTLGQAGGSAAGPLLAGVLAEWAPFPHVLCYVVGAVLTAGLAVAVWRIPEPPPSGGRWRPQWPSVPRESRGAFARAALAGALVWGVGALFLSVVPTYAAGLLGTHDLAVLGAITAVMLGTACAIQVVALRSRLSPAVTQAAGLLALVAGLGALVGAFPPRSVALLLVGAVLAGAGLGLGYVGAQTQVNQLAPAQRRGEVTAAFVTCVYLGVTVSAIGVGLLSDALSLFAAVAIDSAVIAAVALVTALWHLRRRAEVTA